jgi:putative membrane protein
MYTYQYPMMNGNDYGWGFGTALVCLIFLALFVTIIMHSIRAHHHERASKPNPLEIVNERYAKGEIKKDEYEQLKKDLK